MGSLVGVGLGILLFMVVSACSYGTQINNERGSYPNQRIDGCTGELKK